MHLLSIYSIRKREASGLENLYSCDWITSVSKSMDVGALPATHVYTKVQIDKTYIKKTDVFAWIEPCIFGKQSFALFCF